MIEKEMGRVGKIEKRLEALELQIATGVKAATEAVAAPVHEEKAVSAASGFDAIPEPCAQEALPFAAEIPPLPAQPLPLAGESDISSEICQTQPEPFSSPLTEHRHRIEQLFIENWTGILGAAVVVAGVTFLGIYSALKLGPFARFLLVAGFGGALSGASLFLHRRQSWLELSQWVRSAGAAIFLFACAASGGLPGLGLQWIDASLPSLALLALGLAANLYIAWTGGAQRFAALHVILSMLPLMIMPQSLVSLTIASVVALFGVVLSHRSRWDQHLLAVIVAYFFYHVSWLSRVEGDLQQIQLAGVCGAIAVCLAAALVHYRKDYASERAELWPLLVHLGNWVLVSVAFLVYLTDAVSRSIIFALAGVIAYLLARRARPLGIRWLYLCDTLIAESLMIAALASTYPLIANMQIIMLAVFLETLLFLRLIINEDEAFLVKTAWFAANFTGLLFAMGCGAGSLIETGLNNQNALVLLAGAAAATIMHLYLARSHGEKLCKLAGFGAIQDSLGWLIGMIVAASLFNLRGSLGMETVALLASGSLLLVARYRSPPGLLAGVGIAVVAAHLLSSLLLSQSPWDAAPLMRHTLPLLALAALVIWGAGATVLRQIAIYLLGLYAALAVYLLFNPVSPLIPGVAALLMSLLVLELAHRLERQSATAALLLGYFYLAAFVCAYAFDIIQATVYFGYLRARLLIELFGLGVIVYWWLYHPRQEAGECRRRFSAHSYFLEFWLIAITVINIVETPAQWRPLTWSLLSLALLARIIAERDKRFRMYSIVFYWVSVADVAVIMSAFETPSPHWYDQPDIMSLVAIALQVAYILVLRRLPAFAETSFPPGFGIFGSLSWRVAFHCNYWIYYPFFAGVALFLYWRFDHSVLTLLWAAEAFMVFVMSAVLRENQFRHLALVGLGACLLRLLLIDMAEANLGLRGLVFIGVGLLMLGMNAIYNRYREHFQ